MSKPVTAKEEARSKVLEAAKFWHMRNATTPAGQMHIHDLELFNAVNELYRKELGHD